jgi:hypothetical protein
MASLNQLNPIPNSRDTIVTLSGEAGTGYNTMPPPSKSTILAYYWLAQVLMEFIAQFIHMW